MRPVLPLLPALARLIAASCLAMSGLGAQAGVISRELEHALATRGTHADTSVIVRLSPALAPDSLAVGDRRQRDNRLFAALKLHGTVHRAGLETWLAAQGGVRVKDLWIINGLAVTLPAAAVRQLAALDGVARVDLDSFVQGGRSQRTPAARTPRGTTPVPPATLEETRPDNGATRSPAPGWNIAAVHAPRLWEQGYTGQGVVVATMDTGVDLAHPALRHRWRGGTNSWFDPHAEEVAPYDSLGHGTQATSVIVGGPAIGVAPGARWIAVRLYDSDGRTSMSDIHRAFQWLMDPDGDPATIDAPDVVNASWALTGRVAGSCVLEFGEDIRALRSAGIAVVFAAGNDGPAMNTSNSPGNNPGVLAVGAVDRDGVIARQASRGPSSCDGEVFPRLAAPGVNVRAADLSHGGQPSYTLVSGSSLAAPHVAGVIALLAGAFPSASVAELETALARSAQDLGEAGPDNLYGHGFVDALAAFNWLREARAMTDAQSAARAAGAHAETDANAH